MTEHFSIMVPGANSKDGLLEVHAPYDQALIATVDTADTKVVEQALTAATSLYKNRDGWLPAEQRIQILGKSISLMEERKEELAIEAAREGGKPLIDSKVEITRAIDGVRLCIETLRTESGREIPMGLNAASSGHLAFTRKPRRLPLAVLLSLNLPRIRHSPVFDLLKYYEKRVCQMNGVRHSLFLIWMLPRSW